MLLSFECPTKIQKDLSVPRLIRIFALNINIMFKFICLGSGSSGNCYLLFSENYGILIDAGIGIRILKKHLRTFGMGLDRIKAVLITHDHADHIKAAGYLSKDYNVPIYATHEVHQGIDRNYCVTTKIQGPNRVEIQKNVPFQIEDLEIMAFDVPHDSSDNVGYSVSFEGKTFCLITDAGAPTLEMEEQIKNADYLVLESNHDTDMLMMGPYPAHLKGRISGGRGHLSNRQAAELLARSVSEKMKQVWLCHLSEENNHPELAKKTMDSVLRSYGMIMNKDFRVDVLRRKIPSEIHDL